MNLSCIIALSPHEDKPAGTWYCFLWEHAGEQSLTCSEDLSTSWRTSMKMSHRWLGCCWNLNWLSEFGMFPTMNTSLPASLQSLLCKCFKGWHRERAVPWEEKNHSPQTQLMGWEEPGSSGGFQLNLGFYSASTIERQILHRCRRQTITSEDSQCGLGCGYELEDVLRSFPVLSFQNRSSQLHLNLAWKVHPEKTRAAGQVHAQQLLK